MKYRESLAYRAFFHLIALLGSILLLPCFSLHVHTRVSFTLAIVLVCPIHPFGKFPLAFMSSLRTTRIFRFCCNCLCLLA
jgi:hypothetical protein